MTEQETIETGIRLEQFLADPAVVAALARLDAKYYAEFKKANLPEALAAIKAKVDVLDDLLAQFRVAVDSGKTASITRDRREKSSHTRGNGR